MTSYFSEIINLSIWTAETLEWVEHLLQSFSALKVAIRNHSMPLHCWGYFLERIESTAIVAEASANFAYFLARLSQHQTLLVRHCIMQFVGDVAYCWGFDSANAMVEFAAGSPRNCYCYSNYCLEAEQRQFLEVLWILLLKCYRFGLITRLSPFACCSSMCLPPFALIMWPKGLVHIVAVDSLQPLLK